MMEKLKRLNEQLEEAFAAVFAAHPKLQEIRWRQYTPYFNDGDACTFSVGTPEIKFDGMPKDAGDEEDGWDSYSSWQKEAYVVGFEEAYEAVDEIFSAVPDDLMLMTFDDHVTVTATREGFEAEEYTHD